MIRTLSEETTSQIGQRVTIFGWVHAIRDMGKIIFVDLRDRTGLVQIVITDDLYGVGKNLKSEYVIKIEGIVQKRGERMVNPKIPTGTIEVAAESIEVLNEAKTLPFEIDKNTKDVNEELRLTYRYLDLRSARMKKNVELRSDVINAVRNFLRKQNFTEIETPYLTKGTPEGAREYLVPSRVHPGNFFVLPQSPQQFKQLLMIAGFERYFQIARCFRDEDPRGDRQPEFTQIDIEMSFISQNDIMNLVEDMMIELVGAVTPQKQITQIPFPRIPYHEAMEQYKTDKPDLRRNKEDQNELAFAWIVDMPLFEWSERDQRLVSAHHPFTRPLDDDLHLLEANPVNVRACAYDLVLNGYEIGGGSLRIHRNDLQKKIFKILGLEESEIQDRFGHFLKALEYGTPPHGGIAPGLDRIVMILANEPNIREVIAFPKTSDARDLMMGAPSALPEHNLREAHIIIKK